ncbi:regulatory protein RecX [Raoultibacter massiliensis]|uniref:Regulatory protein RecX n=1 Tax=Raoultibacter massiliensis TaxID=1852371 RepID=A0ABV1JC32_9ACTN
MPYIDERFIEDLRRKLGDEEPSSQESVVASMRPAAPSRAASAREALGDEAFEAYKKIQRLASVSERSTKALRERLAKDGYAPEAVDEAIERAVSYGIVDDRRYAEAYVRTKLRAGKGRRGIESDLRDLGIDPEEIGEWCESDDDEVSRALVVLEKRPPTAKNKRDAAYRRLISKGYSSSAAQSAARMWSESL